MNGFCFIVSFHEAEQSRHQLLFFVVFVELCCMNIITEREQKYIWQETINYLVFYIDTTRDVSKVIDYLKVRSLHNITSFFWFGGGKSNNYIRGEGIEIEKTQKKLIS